MQGFLSQAVGVQLGETPALYRHPDIAALRDAEEEDPRERAAKEIWAPAPGYRPPAPGPGYRPRSPPPQAIQLWAPLARAVAWVQG